LGLNLPLTPQHPHVPTQLHLSHKTTNYSKANPRDVSPIQKLKLRVARKLRRGETLGAFWQARFYDFNVYSTGKKMEKLHYMGCLFHDAFE
jgi:hypothetical protein